MHLPDIPVFQGAPAAGPEPPPWRTVADGLAGIVFAPPRSIRAEQEAFGKLAGIIESRNGSIHYLALGPLTNLARIEQDYPETLARIHTLWIPGRWENEGRLRAWNLSWDAASTRQVLSRARSAVIIDIDSIGDIEATDLLSSVSDSTPAGRWITGLVNSAGGKEPHLMIYDELAAAALIDPDLITIREGAWSLDAVAGDEISLKRSPEGNLRIASFVDGGKAFDLLRQRWSAAPPMHPPNDHDLDQAHDHEHDHDQDRLAVRDLLKGFHGHLGPYVVLGYRMGRLALEKTGSGGHFGISAHVYTKLEPPPSCIIDGIQIGSGCTLGKRNIQVHASGGPAHVVFNADNGKTATIRLRAGIPGLIAKLVEESGVESAGDFFLGEDLDSLFEVEIKP
jgi:inosine-uridine nucleoside N-ribohydrolase